MEDRACTAVIPKTIVFDSPDSSGWRFGYTRRVYRDGSARVRFFEIRPSGEKSGFELANCSTEAEAIGRTLRRLSGKLLGVRNRDSEAFKAIKAFLADHKVK